MMRLTLFFRSRKLNAVSWGWVSPLSSPTQVKAEPFPFDPILMALKLPQMLFEDIAVTQLGPYSGGCPLVSEDIGVWDVAMC